MEPTEEVELARLLGKKFIARSDVYAIQGKDGSYRPSRTIHKDDPDSKLIPWSLDAMLSHLRGEASLGHYMVADGKCKLFAFDMDLNKKATEQILDDDGSLVERTINPREIWTSRHPEEDFDHLKRVLRWTANMLAVRIKNSYGIDVAVAYSGSKGIHVYGFTGLIAATEARSLAFDVLNSVEYVPGVKAFSPSLGDNFFKSNYSELYQIEVFPKQADVGEGNKEFGNLMRLPLGKNAKGGKAFFLDMSAEDPAVFAPLDPFAALSGETFLVGAN